MLTKYFNDLGKLEERIGDKPLTKKEEEKLSIKIKSAHNNVTRLILYTYIDIEELSPLVNYLLQIKAEKNEKELVNDYSIPYKMKVIAKMRCLALKIKNSNRASKEASYAINKIITELNIINSSVNEFTIKNLKLVISIAKKYPSQTIHLSDLIQQGNIGLMEAAIKFDYREGIKFSTYAVWWIRQSITRSISNQSRTIRIPVHEIENLREINYFIDKHRNYCGEELDLYKAFIKFFPDKSSKSAITFLSDLKKGLSLDEPILPDSETCRHNFLPAIIEKNHKKVSEKEFVKILTDLLKTLKEKENDVIIHRFYEEMTLKEIGELPKFKVTRERIRQIEKIALGRLRHPTRRRKLVPFLKKQ